jgi:selT/selW/selH-like putative selenoprotein
MRERYPDATVELIPSRGGRFEVAVDGMPVFEKSRLGRHARPGEIAELVARTRDGAGT